MAERVQPRRSSWQPTALLAVVVGLFDLLMIEDAFLSPVGRPDVLTRWRGSPWPALLLGVAWAAHLRLAWLLFSRRWPRARGGRAAVWFLTLSLIVFHALYWVDASWWRTRLGLKLPSPTVGAQVVSIALLEKSTQQLTRFALDVVSSALVQSPGVQDIEVPPITKYDVRERHLLLDGQALAPADEILYQCHVDNVDLVIVRVEHNSLSDPLRLLIACSGHPIQVSTIVALVVRNKSQVVSRVLARQDHSYLWQAGVFH